MAKARRHWLMKSEPDVYSIDDLAKDGTATWEGVRNYQARNFMKEMALGDRVLFYHSSTEPPGVAGLAEVSRVAHPDPTQFDETSPYHDPKAKKDDPRWWMVEVKFVERFDALVSLARLKEDTKLEGMLVTRRGQRLSVQPVEPKHFRRVLDLAGVRSR